MKEIVFKTNHVKIEYVEVYYNGSDFRVWPNGAVEKWVVDDENINGYWNFASDKEDKFNEIKEIGLNIIKYNKEIV